MADLRSRNENAELKQRIHFLTNLINSAKHRETQQIPWKGKASSFSSIKPSSSWDKESHCVQPRKTYTKPDYNSSKLSKPIPPGRPLFDKKYALTRTRKSPIGTVSINSTHIVKKVIPSIEPAPSCSGGSKGNVITSNDLSPLPNPSSSLNLDKHSLASLKKLLAAKLEAKQYRKNETKASKDASKKLTHSATTEATKQANKVSEQHLSNKCIPKRQKRPYLTVDSPSSSSAAISVPRKDSDIKKPHNEPQIADQPTVNDVLPTKGDLAKNLQSTEAKIKELTAELTKLKEVAKIVTSSPQKDPIPKQKRHSGALKSSSFQHHKRRTSSNASNSRFTSSNIKRFNHSNTLSQHAAKYVVSKYKIRKVPNKKNSVSRSKLLKPKSPFPRKAFSPRTFHRHSTKSGPYSWSSQNSLHFSWSASRLQKTKYPFRRPPKYASQHGAFVNYRSRYNTAGTNQSLGVWRRNFLARRHSVWQSPKSYHHKSKHVYTREGLSAHRKTSRAQKDFAVTRSKTISVRGVKFQLGSTGKTLKRIEYPATSPSKGKSGRRTVTRVDYRGVTYVETKPGTLEKLSSSQSRWRASQSVHRSIAVTRFSKKKSARQYCMFYCRFGKCNRGDKCQYIHDPEKVAVCTRFLRGTCKIEKCAFSHKVSKDKMPVCSYFLRGRCVRENCPYLHVNVGESAKVCRDFLKGFCPRGEKCTEKHILQCPEFVRTGRCTAGRECRLEHRTARKRKTPTTDATKQDNSLEQTVSESVVETPSEIASVSRREGAEEEVPFKLRKLPAFISISTSDDTEPPAVTNSSSPSKLPKEPLRIKPRL